MKLSIIVVNYNTKELLKKCLDSIIIKGLEAEIIVVDNGSTDESVDYINGLTKLRINGLIIKTILNKENLGFAKAVNLGIKSSSGEAFLLLNSDAQVKPGALEKLIGFEEQVGPAVIGAKMLTSDGTVQGSCFYLPTISRAIKEYWLGKKNYFSKYTPPGNEPIEVEAVSGGAMLISRALIDKIGMLDERYFMYFEDLDFCRRAKKAGYKTYYLPIAEIIHEHGASGKVLADSIDQWKRLIPSSKIYHGWLKHYLISFILWIGQKWQKK